MQYLLAAGTMFAIMLVIDLAGGAKLADVVWTSLAYALGIAAIFIGARYSQSRKR
jgi:hypothetical protein